eukprot:TRINITY_DN2786_c1_g1_i1.p1 TRINITY_DN2786_c1_g1~~TRINITY_DN2786_c1_g1_i1.p1  ORF type:complete len:526 (-),score=162.49 TRINITY_DN2786_c1_g1_i1:154-1731(-)
MKILPLLIILIIGFISISNGEIYRNINPITNTRLPLYFRTNLFSISTYKQGPEGRYFHSGGVPEGNSFIFSGGSESKNGNVTTTSTKTWRYIETKDTWDSNLVEQPGNYFGSVSVAIKDVLVNFGGMRGNEDTASIISVEDETFVYYTKQNYWVSSNSTTKPPARWGHCGTHDDKYVYIFGGKLEGGSLANDLWRYDIETDTWEEVNYRSTAVPSARWLTSITYVQEKTEVFETAPESEQSDSSTFNIIEYLDADDDDEGTSAENDERDSSYEEEEDDDDENSSTTVISEQPFKYDSYEELLSYSDIETLSLFYYDDDDINNDSREFTLTNYIFLFGGEEKDKHLLNDLWRLNLDTLNWELVLHHRDTTGTTLTEFIPPPRRWFQLQTIHNRYLVLYGGQHSTGDYGDLLSLDAYSDAWLFDTKNLQFDTEYREWDFLDYHNFPHSLYAYASFVIDDEFYMFGGLEVYSKNLDKEKIDIELSNSVYFLKISPPKFEISTSSSLQTNSIFILLSSIFLLSLFYFAF